MLDFLIGKKPKILIIGDLMVDNYIWCDCKRVSPEAPVLVMNAKRNDKRLGGAANVYANLQSLGAKAYALSVVGDDEAIYYYGRLIVPNDEGKLRIGMTTQNVIYVENAENVLSVPVMAVKGKANEQYVEVLTT